MKFKTWVYGTEEAHRVLLDALATSRAGVSRAIVQTVIDGETLIKQTLSQPGRGRTYTRGGSGSGAGVTHRASTPGDPPAVDTGRYRASWRHETYHLNTNAPGGAVYTLSEIGPFLELGTRRMASRPHAGPVAAQMADDFIDNVIREVRR